MCSTSGPPDDRHRAWARDACWISRFHLSFNLSFMLLSTLPCPQVFIDDGSIAEAVTEAYPGGIDKVPCHSCSGTICVC